MSPPRTLLGAIALASLVAACPKENKDTPPAAADAGPSKDGGAATTSTFDGPTSVKNACLSCHTEEMLKQQRLTQAQWTKVVTKMVTWGATLEGGEVAPLATYLAETYGLDAGPFEAVAAGPAEAIAELVPADDAPLPKGDAAAGKPLFADKCSGCHGADARGNVGVNLVERPVLYRAADFAQIVRKGKGKMTPTALDDQKMADVLAHVRSLRIPAP